ncbi:conserved Plasmodium protein, unknown function [Plasmodium malariae]|uniref:Uncharacterized protein n=1 Tax=Plasmodium malariae TaxID=5858 RepID=A0A1C3L0Q0_PLAMA|nr:conserved Plasmodium protein, unknown function [Plasmodium malariae]
MKKKKKSVDKKAWKDALINLEELERNKYSLTRDTINERLRPEPEIIENILEELENKIRHYFNLYQIEKEKRTCSEKNNYFLQKEVYNAYASLEKNKIYTKKLEDKLNNIKENQNSLIDTVRRIDLLYIQLDTLVQSFAGVCTQVVAELCESNGTSNTNNTNNASPSATANYNNSVSGRKTNTGKTIRTIKILLDYIYPCRTLDPRINSLYGMLYYQSVGLLKDGKFTSPPIPPLPPVVSSEADGWLPPSSCNSPIHYDNTYNNYEHGHNKMNQSSTIPIASENSFSDLVRNNNNINGINNTEDETFFSKYVEEEQNKLEKIQNVYNSDSSNITIIPQDLLGFDIKVGMVEIKYAKENPRIVCVVRYDNETPTNAIQNSKRVTKPKEPNAMTNIGQYMFNIDSNIHLDMLPPKTPGNIPSFMIDIHDITGRMLIGTSICSFISEKTLKKDSSWDIYSRMDKTKPDIIGKIYVTVYAYPNNAILPAEIFKNAKRYTFPSYISSASKSKTLLSNGTHKTVVPNDTTVAHAGKLTFQKSVVLSKVIADRDQQELRQQPSLRNGLSNSTGNTNGDINNSNNSSNVKTSFSALKGKKVVFKQYTSKNENKGSTMDNTTNVNKTGAELKEKGNLNGANKGRIISKTNNIINKNVSSSNNGNISISSNSDNEKEAQKNKMNIEGTNNTSSVRSLIKNLTKKLETSKVKNTTADINDTPPTTLAQYQKKVQNLVHTKGNNVESVKSNLEKINKSNDENKFNLKNKELIKKSANILKDGTMKIKLPFNGKKELPKIELAKMKIAKTELAKKPFDVGEPNNVESSKSNNANKNMNNSEVVNLNEGLSSNNSKIRPLIKIKIEPKKENLKKIFNKMFIKTPLPTTKEENKDNINVKNNDSKAVLNDEMKKEKRPAFEKESYKSENSIEEKTTIKAKMLSLFKLKPSTKKEATPEKEAQTGSKQIGIAPKLLKKPIPTADSSPLQTKASEENSTLKSIFEKTNKSTVFIDKNKVNVKLTKKIEIKKEIKKFVPKLKNA